VPFPSNTTSVADPATRIRSDSASTTSSMRTFSPLVKRKLQLLFRTPHGIETSLLAVEIGQLSSEGTSEGSLRGSSVTGSPAVLLKRSFDGLEV
jgi:hypothetical protein